MREGRREGGGGSGRTLGGWKTAGKGFRKWEGGGGGGGKDVLGVSMAIRSAFNDCSYCSCCCNILWSLASQDTGLQHCTTAAKWSE